MATTYKAFEVSTPGVLKLVERPIVEPGIGQVRIRVEASGACHSDRVARAILPLRSQKDRGSESALKQKIRVGTI